MRGLNAFRSLVIFLGPSVFLFTTVTAQAATVVVYPFAMDGWAFRITNGGSGAVTAHGALVGGPGVPPAGVGSAALVVGSNGNGAAELRNVDFNSTRLDSITELKYSTYVDSDPRREQAPYIILNLDHDGNGTIDDLLFFEPEYQHGYTGTVPDQGDQIMNTWQQWDALVGGWWSSSGFAGAGPGADVKTISHYLQSFPNAVIRNTGTGLGGVRVVAGFGAGAWDNFVGYADKFIIATSSTTYDFEPGGRGVPIDLRGSYFSGSRAGADNGLVSVTTHGGGGGGGGQVIEKSGGVAPDFEGTYSPFSDALKPPQPYEAFQPDSSFDVIVDLHAPFIWDTGADLFQVGIDRHVQGAHTPGIWVEFSGMGSGFFIELKTEDAAPGAGYTAPSDASRFSVRVNINPQNTEMSATVTPLDGASAGVSTPVGPLAIDPVADDVSNGSFFAAFDSFSTESSARATIMDLASSRPSNTLYLFAEDPYLLVGQEAMYNIGMASLAQTVRGFQAFLQNQNSSVQTFASGSYTNHPFSQHILAITSDLNFASGTAPGGPPTQVDAVLAGLSFNTSSAGVAGLGFRANNPPTRFSDAFGGAVTPATFDSNKVVVESQAPTLTIDSAINNGNNVIGGPAATQGDLEITVTAVDEGGVYSGLSAQPVISIDFAPAGPSGNDVTLETFAASGNTFKARHSLIATTACGPATVRAAAADDAGNTTSRSANFDVNTAQAQLTVDLEGVQLAVGVELVRCIEFTFGGTGGTRAPVTIHQNVTFTDPDGIGGPQPARGTPIVRNIPCDVGGSLSRVSAKDNLHTLRELLPLIHAGNGQYTTSFVGQDALDGGDATDDNVIDILDYGVFASLFSTSLAANTPCGTAGPHPDFSGNGFVGTEDYTFIQTQFLQLGDAAPGNYLSQRPEPKKRATIKEMVAAGVPERTAKEFDSNGDGWITYDEISHWLRKRGG